ncbi:transposase, partial [Paucisalibacillus globulus]
MSNRSYPSDFKYEVIMAYQNEGYSLRQLCFKYQISKNTFYKWKEKFEKEGLSGLEESKTWKRYSKELKVRAVEEYLSGEYSQDEAIRKYDIS